MRINLREFKNKIEKKIILKEGIEFDEFPNEIWVQNSYWIKLHSLTRILS